MYSIFYPICNRAVTKSIKYAVSSPLIWKNWGSFYRAQERWTWYVSRAICARGSRYYQFLERIIKSRSPERHAQATVYTACLVEVHQLHLTFFAHLQVTRHRFATITRCQQGKPELYGMAAPFLASPPFHKNIQCMYLYTNTHAI